MIGGSADNWQNSIQDQKSALIEAVDRESSQISSASAPIPRSLMSPDEVAGVDEKGEPR